MFMNSDNFYPTNPPETIFSAKSFKFWKILTFEPNKLASLRNCTLLFISLSTIYRPKPSGHYQSSFLNLYQINSRPEKIYLCFFFNLLKRQEFQSMQNYLSQSIYYIPLFSQRVTLRLLFLLCPPASSPLLLRGNCTQLVFTGRMAGRRLDIVFIQDKTDS